MAVVTRFAPSPTGFLHIGGARTALFNWLYARRHGGTMLLRIEDTDRVRSTTAAIDAILDGLRWLGISWDGEPVYQFARAARHREVAESLLAGGRAYRCYATAEELALMREAARRQGHSKLYDGRWRDRDPSEAPPGVAPVVRLKAPLTGVTEIEDLVQGTVRVSNEQLDDMVLLRSDGTPTYMLSVVVDDHDMNVTHVIRGDDHLTNAFRQYQLFKALDWTVPAFAHIPLIHGADGAKLSKRHGAIGLEAYREMGILPEALRNYLLRLGWGHGDTDIISTAAATELFDISNVGRSPSRFDMAKLLSTNGHYIRAADDAKLLRLAEDFIAQKLGRPLAETDRDRLRRGMKSLQARAKTLLELADSALIYCRTAPVPLTEKARALLRGEAGVLLAGLATRLAELDDWSESAIEAAVRRHAESAGVELGAVAQPLRAALTGSTQSPGIFEVAAILGREEALARLAGGVK